MRVAAIVPTAVLLAGCMATIPVEDPNVWNQRAEVEVGERAIYDAGAIEVVLTEAGDSHAVILVEHEGISREGRITTDPRGYVTEAPYRIHLVSADEGGRAVIEVTRPR